MALFDRKDESDDELVSGSDAATRALSVAAVENSFVEGWASPAAVAKSYEELFEELVRPRS